MIVYEVKLCEEQLVTVLNAITKQQVISDCADNDTLYVWRCPVYPLLILCSNVKFFLSIKTVYIVRTLHVS